MTGRRQKKTPLKNRKQEKESSLQLTLKDPDWVIVNWHFSRETLKYISFFLNKEENSETILKIYDITGVVFNGENDNRHWEIGVSLEAKTWYINISNPSSTIMMDFGLKDAQGIFYLIARSNAVTIPFDDVDSPAENLAFPVIAHPKM